MGEEIIAQQYVYTNGRLISKIYRIHLQRRVLSFFLSPQKHLNPLFADISPPKESPFCGKIVKLLAQKYCIHQYHNEHIVRSNNNRWFQVPIYNTYSAPSAMLLLWQMGQNTYYIYSTYSAPFTILIAWQMGQNTYYIQTLGTGEIRCTLPFHMA